MRLSGKTAIITGSRRGIGRAIAEAMAREGAGVVITDINLEDCQAVADSIRAGGGRALAVKCDVSLKAEVLEMVRQAVAEFGKVDILVNNAMVSSFKPFVRISEEEWDRTIAVNLKGAFLCSQAAARNMIKNGWGRIINIASVSSGGEGGTSPLLAHYTASKGGMKALSEAMAVELADFGINVNTILPGAIDSGVLPDSIKERALKNTPRGRLGTPWDIAELAVYLASEESDFMTGSALIIDGGTSRT
ncbi:MAG: SDR family oxidoreductase [Dehalococcoidales bacterium]|nr:SDR family oxidoreductase [Dehalococcoidales bacterium]